MEKDDFLKDDFLHNLIKNSPLDRPSDDFVDRVMANLELIPEVSEVKRPFYLSLKSAVPYAIISFILVVVFATSDLPIFNWFPGKEYFENNLLPYFGALFAILKNAFSAKFVSWGLLITLSAGMLFLIDRLLSRRTSV